MGEPSAKETMLLLGRLARDGSDRETLRKALAVALADNARLTAALGEAEEECDRLRGLVRNFNKDAERLLNASEADAATGRAVARRLLPWIELRYWQDDEGEYLIDRYGNEYRGGHAAYLAGLDAGEGPA